MALAIGFIFVCQAAYASSITPERVIDLVNETRKNAEENTLVENAQLDLAAEAKLQDMQAKHYFAHNSPAGVTPWHWIDESNYAYKLAGENLAIDFMSAEDQHQAWLNSETHRQNILNSRYQEIGVAVGEGVVDGVHSTITVQMFGTRELASLTPMGAVRGKWKELASVQNKIVPVSSTGGSPYGMVWKNDYLATINFQRVLNMVWVVALILLFVASVVSPLVAAGAYVRRAWRVREKTKALHT